MNAPLRRPEPADPGFAARCRASFARQKAMAMIGARMASIEPGRCEIDLDWRADLTQQRGFPHGGIYGTAVATMGMLMTCAYVLSMDTFGPIVDNAGGIVEMSGQLSGMSGKALASRTMDVLTKVGIAYAADRQVRRLSKGMLQRTGSFCTRVWS